MAVRDLWHRTLVYFGIAEDPQWYEDDDEDGSAAHDDLERTYRDRPNVRRIEPRRGRSSAEFDDIFAEEERPRRRGRRGGGGGDGGATAVLRPAEAEATRGDLSKVHLISPRSFNDAQQIADRFKRGIPVIINLQSAEMTLSKRLIDFGSGLTYALDGGMERIADKVFLLTPRDVELSAEDRARYVEGAFFNQA
jgi:cell division inhibitor SepF